MTNKFKKGDNVKIRRDQTGGVWQVKEVKERECDKGHPETRFIYLCEEVDSKHQQWIKEERLDKCRSGIQLLIDEIESNREYFHKLLDVKFTYSSGTDGICAGALAELERASHKSWHTTSTNEIKVEDEPKFKVGDWVRFLDGDDFNNDGDVFEIIEIQPNGIINLGIDNTRAMGCFACDIEPYKPKEGEFCIKRIFTDFICCKHYATNIELEQSKAYDTSNLPMINIIRPATPYEKNKLIKAVEKQYNKTYNEETKQWEDMAVEWTPQPFERVLYNYDGIGWRGDFYSHKEDKDVHLVGAMYIDDVDDTFTLIPYKGNEALLGTTDECKTKYQIK